MREGYVQVPGGKSYYRVEGENAPGVPLLLLHGGPGAPHDYLEPLEELADERPVVFYDQLGCGASDRPDDLSLYTLPHFVDGLAALREALGLTRVHILGQSFGAMLAVDYLLERSPSGITSLVLSGPCLSTRLFTADQRAWLESMPEALRKDILEAESSGDFDSPPYQASMQAFYRRHLCRLDPWPDCVNRAFEKMGLPVYHHMWGPSEFTMTGTLKDYDRTKDLGRIDVPVLYVCGEFDEATPETTARYHALTPGSELHVIEDASHMHHLEKPEEFMSVVRVFLRAKGKS